MYRLVTMGVGTLTGIATGAILIGGAVTGFPALVGVALPAFAGAATGAALGLLAGITGGVVGGVVGVVFVLLPFGWLFTHSPLPAVGAAMLVAMILHGALTLLFPH